jgi:hypothetical protein
VPMSGKLADDRGVVSESCAGAFALSVTHADVAAIMAIATGTAPRDTDVI